MAPLTEEQMWVSAARIAATAEPDDPHARFELMQAIVDLAAAPRITTPVGTPPGDK